MSWHRLWDPQFLAIHMIATGAVNYAEHTMLIVLVEVARVEEVGSSEVGSSGKVCLSEKVMLVLLAVEAVASMRTLGSCHQGGFSVVPSRLVLSRCNVIKV